MHSACMCRPSDMQIYVAWFLVTARGCSQQTTATITAKLHIITDDAVIVT